ncbi:hypothetical protein NDU88_005038 [Pleurodeles waltl]|uniref:Endonuclease/exonuclease/phosphatase domain-containing protein n=1 Tax=Pleurodeles waltl TaxID=8319 RepID=A0AAV7NU70_PLEWA|nr:hypothetical protein NDU88_005038 [Pleurodeles waltl]
MIINVYIQPGNTNDYDTQRCLFEEDLESLGIGKAGNLVLMLGDFNHRRDPNSSGKLYKKLLEATRIPCSNFPHVECPARDLSLVKTLGSLGMFCINGHINMDRPAKQTFRISNQACPIDYTFISTWHFGEVLDFRVEHIEGSHHWTLRLTIRSANKAQTGREKALTVQVEYPRRPTTRITESSLEALSEVIVNYTNIRMEEDSKDTFKGYKRGIAIIVDGLKVTLKTLQEGKTKGEAGKTNNNKIWFNQDCRRQKRKVRKLEREYKKRPSIDIKEKLCQAKHIYKTIIRQETGILK